MVSGGPDQWNGAGNIQSGRSNTTEILKSMIAILLPMAAVATSYQVKRSILWHMHPLHA